MNTKFTPSQAFKHIEELNEKLSCNTETNLQYITRLKALKTWLERFSDSLTDEQRLQGEWAAYYESYFFTGCGFSFFARVCMSIQEYEYGEHKPF